MKYWERSGDGGRLAAIPKNPTESQYVSAVTTKG